MANFTSSAGPPGRTGGHMPSAKSGSDMLMTYLHASKLPSTPAAVASGRLIIGDHSHLAPPFSRHIVRDGKVTDGGRYGNWAIGHGSHTGYWDRNTPAHSRPGSSSGAHEELAQTNSQSLGKFLPRGVPFETTFERVFARSDPPNINANVGKHSLLICTSMGVVGR
mmetsp:Transcript_14598/g.26061  ORF Transcript_14598/g.26061 Transcript_14598/m.26061 type:complete len:166 (-) Transcript_14598:59-556(-)